MLSLHYSKSKLKKPIHRYLCDSNVSAFIISSDIEPKFASYFNIVYMSTGPNLRINNIPYSFYFPLLELSKY